jgi:hypothetical protein
MAKPPSKSKSLVPADRRQPSGKSKSAPRTAVATSASLLPILRSELAVAKLVGTGGEIAREKSVTLVTGRGYATRERIVPAEEVYYDAEARPARDGPWLGEADKVAWRDEASGYDCIMMRDTHGGFLSGYVGVPHDHPLWGWDHDAVPPDLGIEVHGGLTYSAICQEGPSPTRRLVTEARRICHVEVSPARYAQTRHGSDYRAEDPHAWWFGFSCNHAYDLIPGDRARAHRFMNAEIGQQYRDDAYVVREIVDLAAQLRAIADGGEADREGAPPPPLGLDPRKGGRR